MLALGRLHEERHGKPIGALVQELLEASRVIETYLLMPHGERAVSNIVKLIDRARDFQLRGEPFGRIVGMLSNLAGMNLDEMESPLSEPGQERVSLLSIHKSKGLEFPMVVLANLGSGKGRRESIQVLPRRSGGDPGLEVGMNTSGAPIRTVNFEMEWMKDQKRSEAERKRLLYVAFTRARDYLVLPLFWESLSDCLFDDLTPAMGWVRRQADRGPAARLVDNADLEFQEEEPPVFLIPELRGMQDREAGEALRRRAAWLEDRRALLERAGTGVERRIPSALAGGPGGREFSPGGIFETCSEVDARGDAGAWSDPTKIARSFGSAVYRVLELVDFTDPLEVDPLSRWAAACFGVDRFAGQISDLVRGALETEIIGRATRGRMFREYPGRCGEEGALTGGAVALLLVEEDGLVIVD